MAAKSPFLIVPEFLSPLQCEYLVDDCNFPLTPDADHQGTPQKIYKQYPNGEAQLFAKFQDLIPQFEQYYDVEYKGTEPMHFEWFPAGSTGPLRAENSKFIQNKWVRHRSRDFTGVLFLSDYQDSPHFDGEFEVYGGKLEFNQHQFGFNPTRGMLILFPSDPHFLNSTSHVYVGNLHQVRFHVLTNTPYVYNSSMFPGNYTNWFAEFN